MAGIAGIALPGRQHDVVEMLGKLTHRGKDRAKMLEKREVTMQAAWHDDQARPMPLSLQMSAVWDGVSAPFPEPDSLFNRTEPFALAAVSAEGLFLARDMLGVKPLYYGKLDGSMAFASEVKALLTVTDDVHEFPPGTWYTLEGGFTSFRKIKTGKLPYTDVDKIAAGLRLKLEQAIIRRAAADEMGTWLSGGVDSSAIAALARPHVRVLHSFVSGVEGAPDVDFGGQMAEFLGTEHHVLIVTLEDLLAALPEVIYHLESFDALLVRSSITNYLTSKMVADYVGAVFSGEGGDELFAGYDYIKDLPADKIPEECEDIIMRLHNTALQRVDRSAQAHGVVPFVPFTDSDVVEYALSIPPEYKLYRGNGAPVEKWILRKAVEDIVPESVLWRPKAKFWQGAGVQELLSDYAESTVSDADFQRERNLPNGWKLNSKEELMYYRIFKEHFGELAQLDWMGRTKGAPVH
jgi:asparagine synthase (glutamine-hydrolysing)